MKNTLNEQEKLIQSKQKDFQNASIFVTKNAVNKLKGVMKSDNKENYFLRMSVEGGSKVTVTSILFIFSNALTLFLISSAMCCPIVHPGVVSDIVIFTLFLLFSVVVMLIS